MCVIVLTAHIWHYFFLYFISTNCVSYHLWLCLECFSFFFFLIFAISVVCCVIFCGFLCFIFFVVSTQICIFLFAFCFQYKHNIQKNKIWFGLLQFHSFFCHCVCVCAVIPCSYILNISFLLFVLDFCFCFWF